MAIYSREQFIEKVGKIVAESNRMILVINDEVEIHTTYFTYENMQRLIYLLQRTSCEWWLKPVDHNLIKLRVRLF